MHYISIDFNSYSFCSNKTHRNTNWSNLVQWITIYYNIFTRGRARDRQHRQQHCRNCHHRRCPMFPRGWPPKDLHAPSHLRQVLGLQPLRTFSVDMSQTFWSVFTINRIQYRFATVLGEIKSSTLKTFFQTYSTVSLQFSARDTAFMTLNQSVIMMFTTLLIVLQWLHHFSLTIVEFKHFYGPLMLNSKNN